MSLKRSITSVHLLYTLFGFAITEVPNKRFIEFFFFFYFILIYVDSLINICGLFYAIFILVELTTVIIPSNYFCEKRHHLICYWKI